MSEEGRLEKKMDGREDEADQVLLLSQLGPGGQIVGHSLVAPHTW